jgi:hypothetical protein
MVIADRVFACVIAVFVGAVFGPALMIHPDNFAMPVVGLVPAVLVLIRRVWSMALVAVVGLPCFIGSSFYCDATDLANFPTDLLHRGHDWVWLISLYGFVRLIQLARQTSREP